MSDNKSTRRGGSSRGQPLGETVVSGEVTPDRFVVSRSDVSQMIVEPGHKGAAVFALGSRMDFTPETLSLNQPQVEQLAWLALRVEEFFGHAVDIEWGWHAGRFALLQARAIRGLDVVRDAEIGRQEEVHRLKSLSGGRRRLWITHNLAETLAAPTPLTWDIVAEFMRGGGGFGRMYQQLGYRPSPEVCEHGFLELICGRIYADPERLAQLFFDGLPLRYELDALVADRSLLDRAPTTFDAQRADGRFLTTLLVNLAAMWRISRRMRRRGDVRSQFVEHVLPAYLQYVERERARNLAELDERQLLAELKARIVRVLHDFGPQSLRPGFFGGLAYGRLEAWLQQIVGPAEGAALASDLTRALEGDTTFEQDALLYDVACGKAAMAEFLERFGHRATGEMELSQPRWREAPQYLELVIARWRNSATRTPVEIHTDNAARRCAAERELPSVLRSWGGSSFREEIERDLAEARRLLPFRESGKHYLMQGYELIRSAIEDLARRWELGGDIYFLRREELRRWPIESTQLKDQILKRRTRWQAMQRLELPDVIDSSQIDGLGLAQHVAFARELVGRAIASGLATGRARVVFDPLQSKLEQGDILVCPSTDPGWTPLFLSAGGLVIERGGVLSHGAIVARDFGIPAVACPHATRALRDGDRIRVDGNTGRVHVLSRENGHV